MCVVQVDPDTVSHAVPCRGKTANSPVGNAQPGNAVKFDHGCCTPIEACEPNQRDHRKDTEVRHHN